MTVNDIEANWSPELLPLASIGALVLDLVIGLLLMFALMIYYRWPVVLGSLLVPVYILGTLLAASGLGVILSALNVHLQDVKYAVPFLIQVGLFVRPDIYPLQYVPARYRLLLGFNPMSGMIVGFRHSMLGSPSDWATVALSLPTSVFYWGQDCLTFGGWSGASRRSSEPEFPSLIRNQNWRSASNVSIYARPNAMKAVRRPTPNG
jgi:ABC-type polysaccharide/polyol phosphate export permease